MGVYVYAEDIFLLSSSRAGLQAMITECEVYATKYDFTFSTNADTKKSKTKCLENIYVVNTL